MTLRTYLVSGAGSGIGQAAALQIARQDPDAALVLVGRREAALAETRAALPHAARHTVLAVSQADRPALAGALRGLGLAARNLVAVVANAGVGGANQYGDDDRWDEIIATNLTGTYTLVSECLPALAAAREPVRNVVVVSSILSRLGVPGYAAYCASKAGLNGLVRSWAATYAAQGILVNAVLPGWVDTDMARQGIEQMARHTGKSYEEARAREMRAVPTGRMATPDEVAALIAWLVSGAQRSCTGQCFDINNGALMP